MKNTSIVKKENAIVKLNDWARRNPKIFWPIALVLLYFWFKFLINWTNPDVDPCKCVEVGVNAQIIGYHNLSEKSKETFDDCENKYTTTSDAMNDCANK